MTHTEPSELIALAQLAGINAFTMQREWRDASGGFHPWRHILYYSGEFNARRKIIEGLDRDVWIEIIKQMTGITDD
jgi:hypothetical protein